MPDDDKIIKGVEAPGFKEFWSLAFVLFVLTLVTCSHEKQIKLIKLFLERFVKPLNTSGIKVHNKGIRLIMVSIVFVTKVFTPLSLLTKPPRF